LEAAVLTRSTCQGLEREVADPDPDDALARADRSPAAPTDPSGLVDVPASTFLTSQRLWYRAPEPFDAPLVASWRNDPRVRRTTSPRFPSAQEAARKWIEEKNPSEREKANNHATLVFGRKGTVEPIGYAGLFAINWIDRSAEFGIAIGPAHWSQGYGREVARLVLDYGFGELNLHRVELLVVASNPGGIKAYQAAGFVHEGTKRQAALVDGRFEDLLVMGALRDEGGQASRSPG
jgi:diamine N-acetyltransferase